MSGDISQTSCFAPFRRLLLGPKNRKASPVRCSSLSKSGCVNEQYTQFGAEGREEVVSCQFDAPSSSRSSIDTGGGLHGHYPSAYSDVPPSYDYVTKTPYYRPDFLRTVEETISHFDPELRELSLKIHGHPELGLEEFYAHDTLTAFMAEKGFKVTPHYCGLQTAWKAEFTFGRNGRVFGVNAEMDALKVIGHGCGHNLIAISAVGVALAAKAVLEAHKLPGKIVLLGTPAEEGGGGKIIMLDRGAYNEMDFCVMCHPGPGPLNSIGAGPSLARQSMTVEYHGHTAHASAVPWEGVNALDAAVLAYTSVSALRQQIKPNCRVHGTIEGNNWEPNIIPDYAKMRWIVRAPSYSELSELSRRVRNCFEAAALATSCKVEVSLGLTYRDLRQNTALSREFAGIVSTHYGMATNNVEAISGSSTDFGNVTYRLPAFHPAYSIPTSPNGANHTAEFVKSARTMAAHKATLKVSVALALTGLRVLDDDEFYHEVKNSFQPSGCMKS